MHEELWKTVPGYGGRYEVSDLGRVRSRLGRGRILRPHVNRYGYLQLNLSLDGEVQKRKVHHLVLDAWVGERPVGHEACHGDGVKLNNALSNLRWDTHLANIADRDRHNPHYRSLVRTCLRQHPLREPNLTQSGLARGKRECVACKRARGFVSVHGGDIQEVSDRYFAKIDAGSA